MQNANPSPKRVAVFTGNRAEYGLLYPILKAISAHPTLDLSLLVGGDHTRLGTIEEIEADGLPIAGRFEYDASTLCQSNVQSGAWIVSATADLLPKLQAYLAKNSPDIFLVLGDRYESFAATLAAFYQNISIAHIGGGDITEGGCVDDTLRFMMSNLAHLHFTIAPENANFLQQIGIESWRIHITGSPVIDNINGISLICKEDLCQEFVIENDAPLALFTQHPIPSEGEVTVEGFRHSIEALGELGKSHNLQAIATYPNQDGFGNAFETVIEDAKKEYPSIHWQQSLGRVQYLSAMAACDVVLGNSSSGLIETPFFKKASITVGPRQQGRLRASNAIACDYGKENVKAALLYGLLDKPFQESLTQLKNPFGSQPCAPLICDILANLPDRATLLKKTFVPYPLHSSTHSAIASV